MPSFQALQVSVPTMGLDVTNVSIGSRLAIDYSKKEDDSAQPPKTFPKMPSSFKIAIR